MTTEIPVTWPTSSIPHGEYRGWQKCRRRPAGACEPCKDALNAYRKDYRIRTKETKATTVPNKLLAQLLETASPAVRAAAEDALSVETVCSVLDVYGKKKLRSVKPAA